VYKKIKWPLFHLVKITSSNAADDTNCNLTKRPLCTNVNEYNAADLQEINQEDMALEGTKKENGKKTFIAKKQVINKSILFFFSSFLLNLLLCQGHLGPDNSTACRFSVESTIQSELG